MWDINKMEKGINNMKKFTNVRLKGKKELVSILVEDGKIKKLQNRFRRNVKLLMLVEIL